MKEKEPQKERDSRFVKVVAEIKEIIKGSSFKMDPAHSETVLENLLTLNPEADDAEQIAALAHDIDRSMNDIRIKREDYDDYDKYKQDHALKSAEVICGILEKAGYDETIVNKVRRLVENHEVGGEEDTERLKEADSLTFFQVNIPYYQETHPPQEVKDKIRFMYTRLSDEAKKMVKGIDYPKEIRSLVLNTIEEIEKS